jgi:hypothetical protein
MDECYRKIGELTAEYIALNQQFILAVTGDTPAEELKKLKERIAFIIEEIERLEKIRSATSDNKDVLPLE